MAAVEALFGVRLTHHFSQAFPGATDCTSTAMQAAISDWFRMYYSLRRDDAAQEDPCQRIPCTVVAKLQKACFAEYTAEVTAPGGKGEFLQACQTKLDARRKKAMQLAMIGGECWLKPIPGAAGFTFGVVRRDAVAVLGRGAEDEVTDLLCEAQTRSGGAWYNLLERRTVDANGYLTIQNKLYRSTDATALGVQVPLATLGQYASLAPVYTFEQPVGSIGLVPLKMPTENTVDGSCDGVSVYAAATGLIHNINHNEWLLDQEFDNGAIRVMASDDLIRKRRDAEGNIVNRDLPSGLFTGLDDDAQSLGITVFNPELREQSFHARKTEYLRNVESVIGIKRGILSEVEAAPRTAKEITSSEGDYNLTVQDLWEVWETADREALRLCDVLGQLYRLCDATAFDPEEDVNISWGNGVLYDADKEWRERLTMVQAGLLKPELALAWKYDLPRDTPADLAAIREKYMPELDALPGGEE